MRRSRCRPNMPQGLAKRQWATGSVYVGEYYVPQQKNRVIAITDKRSAYEKLQAGVDDWLEDATKMFRKVKV